MTAFGVVVSFVPSSGVDDTGNFQLRIALGVLAFLVPALFVYGWKARRRSAAGPQPVPTSREGR
jgi:hypothetical protein